MSSSPMPRDLRTSDVTSCYHGYMPKVFSALILRIFFRNPGNYLFLDSKECLGLFRWHLSRTVPFTTPFGLDFFPSQSSFCGSDSWSQKVKTTTTGRWRATCLMNSVKLELWRVSPVAQSVQWLATDWANGVRPRQSRRIFFYALRPAHTASCTMGIGDLRRGKCGRGVLLTTHPLPVPRVTKQTDYTSSPPMCQNWRATGNLYLYLYFTRGNNKNTSENNSLAASFLQPVSHMFIKWSL
jgi:hypothetical protein